MRYELTRTKYSVSTRLFWRGLHSRLRIECRCARALLSFAQCASSAPSGSCRMVWKKYRSRSCSLPEDIAQDPPVREAQTSRRISNVKARLGPSCTSAIGHDSGTLARRTTKLVSLLPFRLGRGEAIRFGHTHIFESFGKVGHMLDMVVDATGVVRSGRRRLVISSARTILNRGE